MIGARGLLVLVAVAALVSGWLYQEAQQQRPVADGRDRHDPDSFIEQADLSSLGPDGRLEHRLWSERMLHFPDDDSTELTQPYLEVYRPDAPPWQIRARQGWINSDGSEVLLEQKVEIERAAAPGTRPTRIDTPKLRAFPERDYAETDAPIRYRSDGLDVKSVGMRAYLDQGRVELLSDVRAVHQPKGNP